MQQTKEVKVAFTRSNAKKCICWKCPVQTDSQCIKKNADKMGEVMTTTYFEPQIVPGLYCSSGVASCQDIETGRSCICGGCEVYTSYNLGTGTITDHYCRNGNAQ